MWIRLLINQEKIYQNSYNYFFTMHLYFIVTFATSTYMTEIKLIMMLQKNVANFNTNIFTSPLLMARTSIEETLNSSLFYCLERLSYTNNIT